MDQEAQREQDAENGKGKAGEIPMEENRGRKSTIDEMTDEEFIDWYLHGGREIRTPGEETGAGPEPDREAGVGEKSGNLLSRAVRQLIRRVQWSRGAFVILEPSGGKRKCRTVCTMESMAYSRQDGRKYLIYADGTRDAGGNVRLFVSGYDPRSPKGRRLIPIEDPEEKAHMEGIVEDMKEELGSELNGLPF